MIPQPSVTDIKIYGAPQIIITGYIRH